MNLEDVLDPECGLQQDEWSLTKPRFGEHGQLEVVGWSGRQKSIKSYILKCSKCSLDGELFGEGYFKSRKGNLMNLSQIPCGCSTTHKWSKEQFKILCARKAKEGGYEFLGFVGDWQNINTNKVKMLCETHGQWESTSVNSLLNKSTGCPCCRDEKISEVSTKPDDVMIQSFFASGAFHADTKFWRSGRKCRRGWQKYWYVCCPKCGAVEESAASNLQKGQQPCLCSTQNQLEAYVNFILDNHTPVAIKFGISKDSSKRADQQNSRSLYDVVNHCVYLFPDVKSCKEAEIVCKQDVVCGVIPKTEMGDGFTETTFTYNIDKIKQIYSSYGGVCIFNSEDIK